MTSSVTMKKGQGYVLGTGATSTAASSAGTSSNNVMSNSSISGTSGSAASSGSTAPSSGLSYQEFSVRVPKSDKPMSVMRFNGALNVDMAKWTNLKMIRDDISSRSKAHDFKFDEPDMPKFGAGSEYGREAREEARRRKYGGNRKKINAEDQPWVLKATASDKQTRRFKGLREGTISSNASYFVFTQATDGQFEVFPVSQWYNFKPIQTYKSLSAEEAEEEFTRRDKTMNYFNVMFRKRMRGDEGEGGEKEEEKTSKKKGGGGGLKVSEMEDWDDVNEMESDDDDDDETSKDDKKKKKKDANSKKKKKKGSDSEANEDSDDGDGEGRELDYISDSSGSSEDEETKEGNKLELPGVEQEPGLSNLLESDSSDEESKDNKDKNKDGEEKGEDEEKPNKSNKAGGNNKKGGGNKKLNKKKTNADQAAAITEHLSDGDSDDDGSDAIESDEGRSPKPGASSSAGGRNAASKTAGAGSGNGNDKERESTPEVDGDGVDGRKRKAGQILASASPATKKAKMEVNPALLQTAASEGITEEAVRRYLHRKPMTVTELLQKFKSKKTKVSSEDMVTIIASILKKINPNKRNQNNKMYLSLKA